MYLACGIFFLQLNRGVRKQAAQRSVASCARGRETSRSENEVVDSKTP